MLTSMRHKSRPKTGPRKFWRTLFSQYVLQQTDAEVPNNLLGTAAKETARKSVHRGSAGIRSGETTRKVFLCRAVFARISYADRSNAGVLLGTSKKSGALAADQQLVLTCRSANRAHSRWDHALQLTASVAILPSRSPRLAS